MKNIPEHVKQEFLNSRVPDIASLAGESDKKHGAFTIIFSVWTSMVGTGAIIIPWGFSNSGIVLGVILNIVVFLVCFYTCFLIIKTAGKDTDYT